MRGYTDADDPVLRGDASTVSPTLKSLCDRGLNVLRVGKRAELKT